MFNKAQIATDALGVRPEQVRLVTGDTTHVPEGGSVSASRQTYMCGNAVLGACQEAVRRWQEVLRTETGEQEVGASYIFRARRCAAPHLSTPRLANASPT